MDQSNSPVSSQPSSSSSLHSPPPDKNILQHEKISHLRFLAQSFRFLQTRLRSKTSLFSESSHSHYSSQPRLHSKLSTSSSPICMTGNMQLSQKYKSSADLVSELLRKPVFTRYRSIRKKAGCGPGQKPSTEVNSKLAVISADCESSPVPPPASQSPSSSCDVEMVEVQMVSPVTLRPRIETVKPGREYSHSDESPEDDEVKHSRPESNTNNTPATNNTTNTNRPNSNNADTVTPSSNYPAVFGVYKRTPSLSSQPSSLVSYRVGSLEDLYCDDELHPSLEHDPNMRLMDEHLLDRFHRDNFSAERDDDSILSMSVPSTGPQSLLDTCSTISDTLESCEVTTSTSTTTTSTTNQTNMACWTLLPPLDQ